MAAPGGGTTVWFGLPCNGKIIRRVLARRHERCRRPPPPSHPTHHSAPLGAEGSGPGPGSSRWRARRRPPRRQRSRPSPARQRQSPGHPPQRGTPPRHRPPKGPRPAHRVGGWCTGVARGPSSGSTLLIAVDHLWHTFPHRRFPALPPSAQHMTVGVLDIGRALPRQPVRDEVHRLHRVPRLQQHLTSLLLLQLPVGRGGGGGQRTGPGQVQGLRGSHVTGHPHLGWGTVCSTQPKARGLLRNDSQCKRFAQA